MIKQILKKYGTENCVFKKDPGDLCGGFLFRLRLKEPVSAENSGTVYEIPGTLKITTSYLSSEESRLGWSFNESYYSYPDENGNVPVLEAAIYLDVPYHPERTEIKIGIPLTVYDTVNKELILYYDGMRLYFLYDGMIANENFTAGTPKPAKGKPFIGQNAALTEFSSDLQAVEISTFERTLDRSIHAYSPAGHAAWAGDVVNYYRDGVYHLFFLYDHHHHGNRFCGGAHYFYHLTTTDFVNWTDHGAIFELEEQWQTLGTGTPFFYDGKIFFAFGYHTDRSIPKELLYASHLMDEYTEKGYTTAVSHEEIRKMGLYPNGANLAVSNDGGKTFSQTHEMFHWIENPSVYTKPDGTLFMCIGGGLWESEKPQGPWKLVKKGFPPYGSETPLSYTRECPSFFEKNGYKYVIMGVRGYWRTEKNGENYRDCAAVGEDIYDGLVVPMAVNCGGRLLLSGWIQGVGFASVIIHRELIQFEDGRLGMKWLPEASPDTSKEILLYRSEKDFFFETRPRESYYLEFDADPGENGVVRIIFGNECELRLDTARREAQIGPVGGERISPVHERTDKNDPERFDNTHSGTRDFTIANVDCIGKPYRIRISMLADKKMNSTLIDTEIAGLRTMISNRVNACICSVWAVGQNGAGVGTMSVYTYRMEQCR